MTNEVTPRRKRGCFFYGCITLIVLLLVAALGMILAVRYVQNKVKEYADNQPAPLERVDASPDKVNALQKRIDAFREAVTTQSTAQELALTADDINTLLASQPDLQDLSRKVFVFIENNQLKGKLSWPMDDLGLKGRYFNGTGTFKVAVSRGDLDLHLQDLQTTSGKPLPDAIIQQVRQIDWADFLQRDAQTAAALRYVDTVEIKDDRVVIRSKPGAQ